jgi:AcrR family transcriptional regulator
MTEPAAPGLRSQFRNRVRADVKAAALRQLADGGAAALSLNGIAKRLGVSGPALYRYFTGRDELLGELVVDAYRDLADALRTAAATGASPHERLTAAGLAYRAWALAQPHRYALLYRAPVSGYDPNTDDLVEAAQQAMDVLLDLLLLLPGPPEDPSSLLAPQLQEWARRRQRPEVPAAVARRAVTLWARMHGLVSLELEGTFASMGLDAEALYRAELTAAPAPSGDAPAQTQAAANPGKPADIV